MHTQTSASPALVAARHPDRSITLHTLELDGPTHIGTFASAAEAWTAVDALDLAELHPA
jgi:hypothetical protein